MVHICTPDFSATCGWVGCTFGPWASAGIFDQPVPLEVSRFRLEAGAHVDRIRLGGTEAMIYVLAGSGTALAPPSRSPSTTGPASRLRCCYKYLLIMKLRLLSSCVARTWSVCPR